jgi:hypothetical protein
MAFNFTKILTGLRIIPKAVSTSDSQGDQEVLSTDGKLRHHNGTTNSPVVTEAHSATLTNKSIDADTNTITNIENADIKAAAAIDASKIADGSVSSTEFQYLSTVTSNIQTQLNTGATAISDHIADATDAHDASAISSIASGNLAATDVQAALNELQSDVDTRALATDLSNHISDATDAHDASAISNVATGNLAATDVQTALNELQGDIDTLNTGLSNHLSDATDAHDASAISNVASGNLAATDVQAALNELQTDVDGRALASDLSTHISDTTTHGTTGNVVGTSDAQVLTAKDYDGGTASNTSRITVPKDTKTNLDALTRKEATIVYGSDTDKLYVDNGSALIPVGSSLGSLDIFYQNDFSVDTSSIFSTGDNATFLGGGTLAGTLANETGAPIAGTRSIKYTQASGSLNDYIASPAVALDIKQRGQEVKFVHYFKYSGANSDIKFIVYDVTNTTVLTSTLEVLTSATNPTRYETAVFIPASCTSIRYGFQVAVENIGAILIFDDVEISVNPFIYKDVIEKQEIHLHTFAGNSSANVTIPYFSTTDKNIGATILTLTNNSTDGNAFTALKNCSVTAVGITSMNSAATLGWSINATSGELDQNVYDIPNTKTYGIVSGATGVFNNHVANVDLKAGDVLRFHGDGNVYNINSRGTIQVTAEAEVDSVVTPMKNNLTDWTAYTPTFTGFGTPTSVSFLYRKVGSDVEIQGVFTPSAITAPTFNFSLPESFVTLSSLSTNIMTGDLTFDIDRGTSVYYTCVSASQSVVELAIAPQASAYAKIITTGPLPNAGNQFHVTAKVPIASLSANSTFLAAIPVQRVAYLKDVKSSGTQGGTFTSGAWQTRTLNTSEGDTSIVSLSGDQFTIQSGIYDISVDAPRYGANITQARLRNITDSTTPLTSTTSDSNTSDVNRIIGRLVLTSAKTFEIQHRGNTTRANDGFGADAGFGENNVYTQVAITKVK